MTEPESTETPTVPEPVVTPETTPTLVDPAPAAEPAVAPEEAPAEDTSAEDATDAQLRSWAKENGIEDVPGSGRLSAAWREQITAAMTAALDPKEEVSVEDTSSESSSLTETTESGPIEEPVVEYRTPWEAPHTWVTGQSYTA